METAPRTFRDWVAHNLAVKFSQFTRFTSIDADTKFALLRVDDVDFRETPLANSTLVITFLNVIIVFPRQFYLAAESEENRFAMMRPLINYCRWK